uniref:Uncharacterized protein n=1 Tax=Oryza sativa subsp. japonica TaxID=39947 RepID=Q6ZIG9_ORYSJ|nr:hypothetical protein [Oryza sativa Japonica Group]BAD15441.1 hypothetical protein [Oryza sativa Japonica Group]
MGRDAAHALGLSGRGMGLRRTRGDAGPDGRRAVARGGALRRREGRHGAGARRKVGGQGEGLGRSRGGPRKVAAPGIKERREADGRGGTAEVAERGSGESGDATRGREGRPAAETTAWGGREGTQERRWLEESPRGRPTVALDCARWRKQSTRDASYASAGTEEKRGRELTDGRATNAMPRRHRVTAGVPGKATEACGGALGRGGGVLGRGDQEGGDAPGLAARR